MLSATTIIRDTAAHKMTSRLRLDLAAAKCAPSIAARPDTTRLALATTPHDAHSVPTWYARSSRGLMVFLQSIGNAAWICVMNDAS